MTGAGAGGRGRAAKWRWAAAAALVAVAVLGAAGRAPGETADPAWLDPATWEAAPAEGVALRLAGERGPEGGPALRLDWDFQGRGGWAAARRPLALALPENYELRFLLRGEGPPNKLEVKLIGETGDDVWWHVLPDVRWPAEWTPVAIPKRKISFAWGPSGGGEPERIAALELAVTAGEGGAGSIAIAGLELVPLPPPRPWSGTVTAAASAAAPGHGAERAVDGDPETAWRAAPAAGEAAELVVDFETPRELGGLTLRWEPDRAPRRFRVETSEDGERWTLARAVERGGGARTDLLLTDAAPRLVRLRLEEPAGAAGYGLREVEVRPLAFGASANAFVEHLAREARRGAYPRGFSGEQVYWTVLGAAGAGESGGDPAEGLLSEDGALESGAGGFSIEPFLILDGADGAAVWTWAEAAEAGIEHALADGDLPIPTVAWRLPGLRLEIAALAAGPPGGSALFARYRLTATGGGSVGRPTGRLVLAVRPFQVNPPAQFLNLAGGVAPIARIACGDEGLMVGGAASDSPIQVTTAPAPTACGTSGFDEGLLVDRLAAGGLPGAPAIDDPSGLATAVLAWEFDLAAGERVEVTLAVPLPDGHVWASVDPAHAPATASPPAMPEGGFDALLEGARRGWRERLDRGPRFDLPPAGAELAALARSSLAWILIHRDGAAIQPGSRAYARSWIRDGALTSTALLRLGEDGVARAFAEWYAGFQYPDGRVPCCVDRRGADPVPEHDSHGELIHLVAEVHRFTGDRAFAERLFPHVERAVAAIDALRAERRTEEYRHGAARLFFGLLPESISHEGYAAKPRHSYWDDAFAYRGLDDAARLAAALGQDETAARWAASRDQFRADLVASIAAVRARHGIDHLPGCAELGDFDPTSSSILLEPGGLGPSLPEGAVEATFARYSAEAAARRDGEIAWDAYTPYELRNVGTFVRLGRRERAHELLAFLLEGVRPREWNAWAEVVGREPRQPRFVGDLPHGWVASDFLRSFLDLFAYERRSDGALVLAAGVPGEWLDRPEGIAVEGLRTPWGQLGYRMVRAGGVTRIEIGPLERPPEGMVLAAPPRPPGALGAPRVRIDGADAGRLAGGEVAVPRLPAVVEIDEGAGTGAGGGGAR